MTSSSLRTAGLAVGLAVALGGCVSVEMGRLGSDLRSEAEAQDAEVGRGFAVAFGPGTIGTSRFLGRLVAAESTEPYRRMAGHVRRVKVARYPVEGALDGRQIARPAALARYDADGWLPLVTVREPDAAVWVLYREDADALTDLLAVVVGDGEIVATKVSGDLTALVIDALQSANADGWLDGALDGTGLYEDDADRETPR